MRNDDLAQGLRPLLVNDRLRGGVDRREHDRSWLTASRHGLKGPLSAGPSAFVLLSGSHSKLHLAIGIGLSAGNIAELDASLSILGKLRLGWFGRDAA